MQMLYAAIRCLYVYNVPEKPASAPILTQVVSFLIECRSKSDVLCRV